MAPPIFGLLAYWIVNTIRYRMKLVNAERERQENKDKGGTRDVYAYMRTRKLKF